MPNGDLKTEPAILQYSEEGLLFALARCDGIFKDVFLFRACFGADARIPRFAKGEIVDDTILTAYGYNGKRAIEKEDMIAFFIAVLSVFCIGETALRAYMPFAKLREQERVNGLCRIDTALVHGTACDKLVYKQSEPHKPVHDGEKYDAQKIRDNSFHFATPFVWDVISA
jgi:hypothetical protein